MRSEMAAGTILSTREDAAAPMGLLGAIKNMRATLSLWWIRSMLALTVAGGLSAEYVMRQINSWGGIIALALAALFLALGSWDSYVASRRKKRLEYSTDYAKEQITARLELEQKDALTLTSQIASLTKRVSFFESNNATLLRRIGDLTQERDEALDRASESNQAAGDASQRALEAITLLRDAETRAATLQKIIDAQSDERRAASSTTVTSTSTGDAMRTSHVREHEESD